MRRSLVAAAVLLARGAVATAGDATPAPGTVRAARDAVMARPEFQYAKPRSKSFIEDAYGAIQELLASLFQRYPVIYIAGIALMALVLIVLVAHIIWTMRMARAAEWASGDAPGLDEAMRRGDPAPFRARAVEHAAAGRFDESVRDLYAALLLTLDRRGALRFAAHKALLDYRIETARDAESSRVLEEFAQTYHPGSFGRRPPDRPRFEALLAALDGLTRGAA